MIIKRLKECRFTSQVGRAILAIINREHIYRMTFKLENEERAEIREGKYYEIQGNIVVVSFKEDWSSLHIMMEEWG